MGIKKKVFGTLAAAALTLSVFAGAGAQSTGYVGGDVILGEGACGIVATAGNADFGTWTWDGSVYQPGTQNTFVWLTVKTPWSAGESTCPLQISTDGLGLAQHGADQALPETLFRTDVGQRNASGGWSNGWMKPLPSTHTVRNGDARVQIDLRSVPADYQPGTHSGTFNFTFGDGQ